MLSKPLSELNVNQTNTSSGGLERKWKGLWVQFVMVCVLADINCVIPLWWTMAPAAGEPHRRVLTQSSGIYGWGFADLHPNNRNLESNIIFAFVVCHKNIVEIITWVKRCLLYQPGFHQALWMEEWWLRSWRSTLFSIIFTSFYIKRGTLTTLITLSTASLVSSSCNEDDVLKSFTDDTKIQRSPWIQFQSSSLKR